MQPYDPHRKIPNRLRVGSDSGEPGLGRSLEGVPAVNEVFREIGITLLVCLALPVGVQVLMRIFGQS